MKLATVILPVALIVAACARDIGQTHDHSLYDQATFQAVKAEGETGARIVIGRVVDIEGRPVHGAQVLTEDVWHYGRIDLGDFIRPKPYRPHCGWTNSDGRFRVLAPPPGELRVVVRKLGYAELNTSDNPYKYEPLLFSLDRPTTDVGELILAPGAILEGVVVDSEGNGIAGVGIFRSLSSGHGWSNLNWTATDVRLATTDAAGHFRVDVLGPGDHWLTVLAPGFFEGVLFVEGLAAGEARENQTLVLERGAIVSGSMDSASVGPALLIWVRRMRSLAVDYVRKDLDYLGDRWGEVRWTEPDSFTMAFVPVDANGEFLIGALSSTGSPGTQLDRIWLTPIAGWNPSIQPVGPTIVVAPGAENVQLKVVPPSTISVDVVDASTGQPIEVLDVRVAPGGWIPRPLLNEDGTTRRRFLGGRVQAEVRALGEPQGARLTIAAPGYRAYVVSPQILPGEDEDLGTIELEPVGPGNVVEVLIRDAATGEPCSDVGVEMTLHVVGETLRLPDKGGEWLHDGPYYPGEVGVRVGRTDSTGRLLLSPHNTDARLWAMADGYLPAAAKVPRGGCQIEIALDALPRLDVLVLDPQGESVANVPLSMEQGPPQALTDSGGRAMLTYAGGPASFGVAPRYGLIGPHEEGSTAEVWSGSRQNIDLGGGERLDVILRLPESVPLEGRILMGGKPLAGGFIFGRRGERLSWPLIPDGQGRFRHERVAGEPFDMLFTHPTRIGYDELEVEFVDGVAHCEVDLADTRVVGRLVDENGIPIGGVRLQIAHYEPSLWDEWDEDPPWTGEPFLSDADGTFQLHGVPAGERFALRLEAPHVLPLEWSVRALQTGSRTDLGDIGMHRAAELRVLVHNSSNEFVRVWIAEAGWFASRAFGGEIQEPQSWRSSEIDLYYESLEPGEYVIQVRHEGGTITRRVTLVAGEKTEVEIDVP